MSGRCLRNIFVKPIRKHLSSDLTQGFSYCLNSSKLFAHAFQRLEDDTEEDS